GLGEFRQKWKRPFQKKLRFNIYTDERFAKPEFCDGKEKTPDGLLLVLCEISSCKSNRSREQSFTSTWIAFMRRSKCVIARRCAGNRWAWVARATGAVC